MFVRGEDKGQGLGGSKPALLALPEDCPTAWSKAPSSRRRGRQRLEPEFAAPSGGRPSDSIGFGTRVREVWLPLEQQLCKKGELRHAQGPKAMELGTKDSLENQGRCPSVVTRFLLFGA